MKPFCGSDKLAPSTMKRKLVSGFPCCLVPPAVAGLPASPACAYSAIDTRTAFPSLAQAKAVLISAKGNVWEMIRSKG